MKRLFRYTSTLLRTVLLFGALAFTNIQLTQAQTAAQLAAMPNAFETVNPTNPSIIGNGEYYYIQFYYNGPISYLTDRGENKKAWASDFLPSNNRLWTLVSAGDNQFKLKSKEGYYLGWARFEGSDRYGSINNPDNAVKFTLRQEGDGYNIFDVDHNGLLARYDNNEWTDFPYRDDRQSHKNFARIHFVKLKDNVAYIIYYRGEDETDPVGNTDPSAASTRHYLTYSGLNDFPDNWNTAAGWASLDNKVSVITNGNLDDASGDISCFYQRKNNVNQPAPIGNGVSGNGIAITSSAGQTNAYDTQFFIKSNEALPEGTRFRVKFNCAASNTVEVGTQAHGEPGTYHHWDAIGNVNFPASGDVIERWGTVTAEMAREDGMQSIAFNLGMTGSQPETTFYIDNIEFEIIRPSDISTRTSVLNTNESWALPTASAYHQDGLWSLEETGTPGEFFIKRYESTDEYLNYLPVKPDFSGLSVLGTKNYEYGRYTLENPSENRYTRIQNVKTAEVATLNSGMFYQWDGYGAYPNKTGSATVENYIGQSRNAWDMVIGDDGVLCRTYADLTGYSKMIIEGTPGVQLRVLLDRQTDNNGPYCELNPEIGTNGSVEVDLTSIQVNGNNMNFAHLNAIKMGNSSPSGTITSIKLIRDTQYLSYSDNGNHEGKPVMQFRYGNDNWLFGFRPVEVPVPNKDNFYQVLVKWTIYGEDRMINHYGGWTTPFPTNEADYDLWQLEMVDDYNHFRLKAPNGVYLKPDGNGVTAPNDPTDAEILTNMKFQGLTSNDFTLTWFYVNPVAKEIPVDHYVRHKESYLRTYADDQVIANQEGLRKQGLSRDIDSDWKNFTGDLDGMTQKTNHFEITHYIKKGNTSVIEFPTVLNYNNDHVFFQRFYRYDEIDEGMDLANLKAHVSLDTRDDGNVQYFLYKNGMVTGQKLNWTYNDGTAIPDGGMRRNEQRRFNFTNSDGQRFTVGVDVSRYSDLEYLNPSAHLSGDLREPSLTMRYIFYMRDAKEMAKNLTACPEGGNKWLEEKTFHFGRTQVPYTKFKKVGYRGEFIPVRHVFSDYWVYDDPNLIDEDYLASLGLSDEALSNYLDQHLVSAVNDNTSGKIEVEIEDDATHPTRIRLGGYNPNINLKGYDDEGDDADYKGFYFYDKMSRDVKNEYGSSRFIVFRYPASGQVVVPEDVNVKQEAKINVYLNAGNKRYQLAQYTIIFDANMATRPWTEIKNGTTYANNINQVKGTDRDPNKLRERAGKPIAKVSFDFPQKMKISGSEVDATYHYPLSNYIRHDGREGYVDADTILHYWVEENGTQVEHTTSGTIANSSPIPLTFGHTNYSFDGDGCNWGSYALVTGKLTQWGNGKIILPADDEQHGYNIDADPGMQKAFMYIDASEQPGDICAVDFEGEFCPNDKLMCSGWISGSNRYDDDGEHRCPGSITITIKGEDVFGNTKTIYRFCPGQIYELDNGYEMPGATQTNELGTVGNAGVDGRGNGATHVVWQQFYFEFSTDQKYERYWLELNNNCVSSNGGDFMIDNVEVYTIVPEVEPEINTPLCVGLDENGDPITEMRLLKLDVNYNKLKSSANATSGTAKVGFVFLEKETFLKTLWNRKNLSQTYEDLDAFAQAIKEGKYLLANANTDDDYKAAFNAALLGDMTIWDSTDPTTNMGGGIMYFQWSATFEDNNVQPQYSFANAVNKQGAVFRYVDAEGSQWLVFNGNYPGLDWKTNTDYYIVPTNHPITDVSEVYGIFNIFSDCSRATVFRIEPPYRVLGLEGHDNTEDYVVCEGQIPTLLLDLKGYDLNGNEVDMTDLNYDWWLGKKGNPTANPAIPPVLATLTNYHTQSKTVNGEPIRLDKALATMRTYYPRATSLDGIQPTHHAPDPALTQEMIDYLKELVAAGELVLHQKSVSVPAEPASEDDPYFYLVACPIHDEMFDQALNPGENEYVSYYCDEPQGVRIKVGEKAPTLKSGFVPGEHGFNTYDYNFPAGTDPVLSIRLAKKYQFETVKNAEEEATGGTLSYDVNHLWLPIRNARTQTASGVIQKTDDDNIYLASTNDPTWDKEIYKSMNKNGLLPVVGRIVALNAINTQDNSEGAAPGAQINLDQQNANNRLRVYFTKNFEVREGYSYTLSLPFQEIPDGQGNAVNTCDGTILINLKIVPDYEVWTGAAGNTDWNNDENWRRADGNTVYNNLTQEQLDNLSEYQKLRRDELYVASAKAPDEQGLNGSPLYDYKTNEWNYRTQTDRVFRKGFAPLYCTHILMKSDEWGNAPVLYDPLDYDVEDATHEFNDKPFPNLRETSTPILKFDMQARRYDMWYETYGENPDRGETDRTNDLIAEMYKVNSCDEIAFQSGTELLNAHLLNYNSAWMEYQLENKRWYLLGSPLQGTISGEWYAPTGNAKQETTYYDPVKFNDLKPNDDPRYDRYSPAIYQRSWDKAKAVLYEIGSDYALADDSQTDNLGYDYEGIWSSGSWNVDGGGTADEYLDRLGYKPMGGNKANVAIKGIWSNTYNDAQVDYANGGFSVMVMNHVKGNDQSGNQSLIRLPKEDTMYDYYKFSEDGSDDGGTDTDLTTVQTSKSRALNRGRLKTDLLLPTTVQWETTSGETTTTNTATLQKQENETSVYGDKRYYTRIPIKEDPLQVMNATFYPQGNAAPTAGNFTETIPAGISQLGYYLVENPFPCGLDMNEFFAANPTLEAKYWLLTKTGQHLVQKAKDMVPSEWITTDLSSVEYPDPDAVQPDPNDPNAVQPDPLTFYPYAVLAPGQGFFVTLKEANLDDSDEPLVVTFNNAMQTQSRFGVIDGEGRTFNVEVGQTQRMEPLTELVNGVEQAVYIETDYNENGIYGEALNPHLIINGVEKIMERDTVMVPVYEMNGNEYVLDAEGNKIPVLDPITEDVVLYKYKQETLTLADESTITKEYPLRARRTRSSIASNIPGLVITAQRGNNKSSALVMKRETASDDFLPSEDTETFICTEDLKQVPTVYTLCGRLATTINSIHDFTCLPLGVESASDAPCTLTFEGVELLGDSVAFYDAVERKLTPLESGMKFKVSGQTQNRYYIVSSLNKETVAEETHLQIFTEGRTAKVIASTAEPITNVRCFDTAGRLVHSASPQTMEYSFTLPDGGIYIIEAQTEKDRKTKKVAVK